jgi:hypothetical protein
VLIEPLPDRLSHPRVVEPEPPLALARVVDQHGLEPPERTAPSEGALQALAEPRISDRRRKLLHPAVLDQRLDRLDVDQIALGESVIEVLLGRLVALSLVTMREDAILAYLARAKVEIRLALVVAPRQRELEAVPVDRDRTRRGTEPREDACARWLIELVPVESQEQRLANRDRRGRGVRVPNRRHDQGAGRRVHRAGHPQTRLARVREQHRPVAGFHLRRGVAHGDTSR